MTRTNALAALVLSVAAAFPGSAQAPSNDECSGAVALTDGINGWFTNVGSTTSAGVPACLHSFNKDVWFTYTAITTGTHVVETCTPPGLPAGSLLDSVLSVLDGSACPPSVQLGCNDDACGSHSTLSITFTAGTLYYVRVAGYAASVGTFYVSVAAPPPLPPLPPPNDECSAPIPLTAWINGPYPNDGATNSAGVAASCGYGGSPGYADIWFSYTQPCSGLVTISTGCDSYDTILSAYGSCGGAEVACNDDYGCGWSSLISFPVLGGTTYLIRLARYYSSQSPWPVALSVNVSGPVGMGLGLSSPFGVGSLRIDVGGGPPLGTYFLALTTNAGSFPNGWLYGVDMPLADLSIQLAAGWPFFGPLSACGDHQIGPFVGVNVLSGIPLYAVALGIAPGAVVHSMHSPPATHTVP